MVQIDTTLSQDWRMPMQLDAAGKFIVWPLVPLMLITVGMTFMLYVTMPLPDSKLIGGFLLLVGLLNAPFSQMLGRRMYNQTFGRPFVGWFWKRCGEKGSQLFFLGLASILALAGCILFIFGSV